MSIHFVLVSYTWKMTPDPNKQSGCSVDLSSKKGKGKTEKMQREKWQISFVPLLPDTASPIALKRQQAGMLYRLKAECVEEQVADPFVWL